MAKPDCGSTASKCPAATTSVRRPGFFVESLNACTCFCTNPLGVFIRLSAVQTFRTASPRVYGVTAPIKACAEVRRGHVLEHVGRRGEQEIGQDRPVGARE